MTRRVCPVPGCPTLTAGGRCDAHRRQSDRDRRPHGNPYNNRAHRAFREQVLTRDPVCTQHLHPDSDGLECFQFATVADHYPRSRAELVAAGLDPNDPQYGRGLCKRHHDRLTAVHQPGGWHAHPGP